MRSNESLYKPQCINKWTKSYITIDTHESPLINTLFPDNKAPVIYSTGISNGKLNGAIITTGPYGNQNPFEIYPSWSPAT